jgi:hypothetical protein
VWRGWCSIHREREERGASLSDSLSSSDPSPRAGSPCHSRCSSPPQQLHGSSPWTPVTSCSQSSYDPNSDSSPRRGRAKMVKVGSAPATGHQQALAAAGRSALGSKTECPWAIGSADSSCCSGQGWWDSTWLVCRIAHPPAPHPTTGARKDTK